MGEKYAVQIKAKVVTDQASIDAAYKEIAQVLNKEVGYLKEQERVTANIKQLNGETVKTVLTNNSLSKQTTYNNNELYNLKKQIAKKTEEIERKLKQVNESEYGIKMSAKDELAIREKMDKLKSINIADEKDISVLRNYNNELKNVSDQFKNATKSTEDFSEKIKKTLSSLVSWAAIVRSIKYAVDTVVELDGALTELNKVTDISSEQLKDLTRRAYEAGDSIAHTGKEVIEATTEFAKMGYTTDESLKLGQLALLYTNIADEEVSAGEAASFMISQMKAFNISASDSIHIIDAINAVSNKYAVSSADLADSIGAVSATLAESGTSYEETLGLLTGIVEITRDANKASTALKTISQRIRGVGEDIEDSSEYVGKLQKAFDKLGVNVQIVKAGGAMESSYNILSALAEKWDDLTDAERQSIGELAAGKNRITEFNALMSNFDTTMKATETAINSTGSAMKENAAYLDSIEGKWNALVSQLQKMISEGSLGEIIKDFLDLAKASLELIEALGGLKPILAGIITFKAGSGILKFLGGDAGIKGGFEVLKNGLSSLKTGFFDVYASTQLAGGGVKGFITAIGSASVPIAAAIIGITALVAEVKYLSGEFDRNSQSAESASAEYEKMESQVKSTEEQIESIDKQIKELSKNKIDLVDQASINKLKEQRAELEKTLEIQKKLAQAAKTKASEEAKAGISGVGKYTRGQLESAGVETGQMSQAKNDWIGYTGLVGLGYVIGEKTLGFGSMIEQSTELLNANKNLRNELKGLDEQYNSLDTTSKDYEKQEKAISKAREETQNKLAKNNEMLGDTVTALKNYGDAIDETDPANKKWITAIDYVLGEYTVLDKEFSTFGDVVAEVSSEQKVKLKELADANELTIASFNENFPVLVLYAKKFAETVGVSYGDVIDKITEYAKNVDIATEKTLQTEDAIKMAAQSILDSKTAYKDVSAAIEEYQKQGSLSASTLANMMINYPKYLDALNKEGWNLKTLNKYLDENAKKHLASAKATNEDALQHIFGANVTLEEAKAVLELNKNLLKSIELKADPLLVSYYQKTVDEQQKTIDSYEKTKQEIDDLEKSLKTFDYGKSSSTKDAWKEAFETEYNMLKHQLNMNEITELEYTNRLESLYKKYFANRKKYLKEYNKYEEEVYKNRKSIFDDEISTVEHQIDLLSHREGSELEQINFYKQLQEKVNKQANYYRSLGEEQNKEYIQELQKQWWDYADKIESLYDSMTDAYEEMLQEQIDAQQKQVDKLNNVASVAQTVIDEEIERLTAEKEALQKTNDEKEKEIELEKLRNALYNARNQRNMRVYYADIGWRWETNKEAIKEAEKALEDFENEQRISKIDDEISELNDLKDEWSNVADTYEKEQNRIEATLLMGNKFEENVLNDRLNTLRKFVRMYNEEAGKLTTAENLLQTQQDERESKSASKKKSNVYYDKNTDYQALINEALARGAGRSELAALEEKRNAKIRGEKLGYGETYYYTKGYSNGGIIDYTGLAQMHGTKAKPEIVLNNNQAASLYNMIKTMSYPASTSKFSSGMTDNSSCTYNINMYEVDNMNKFVNEFKQYTLTHKKII